MKIVSKEHTTYGMKLEFVGIIGSKVGPTRTGKNMKIRIIGCGFKKAMRWCIILE
jgi:hypothetical protein